MLKPKLFFVLSVVSVVMVLFVSLVRASWTVDSSPPKCRVRYCIIEVDKLSPGSVTNPLFSTNFLFSLDEISGGNSTAEDRGNNPMRPNLKHHYSLRTYGTKFPIKADFDYRFESTIGVGTEIKKSGFSISRKQVEIRHGRVNKVVASDDRKHILLVSFETVTEE